MRPIKMHLTSAEIHGRSLHLPSQGPQISGRWCTLLSGGRALSLSLNHSVLWKIQTHIPRANCSCSEFTTKRPLYLKWKMARRLRGDLFGTDGFRVQRQECGGWSTSCWWIMWPAFISVFKRWYLINCCYAILNHTPWNSLMNSKCLTFFLWVQLKWKGEHAIVNFLEPLESLSEP